MDWKRVALGTAAYTFVTFPLAVVWHVALFKPRYEAFGYNDRGPRSRTRIEIRPT